MQSRGEAAQKLNQDWSENSRWKDIKRGYSADDVIKLQGSMKCEYTNNDAQCYIDMNGTWQLDVMLHRGSTAD